MNRMKLKTNKACDIRTISVFPPQSRRLSAVTSGPQASQTRSQPSQQSFSQGISSQHGMFSQLSQASLEESLTNDQRLNSQERDNALKMPSRLPSISYSREESQMTMSRSSNLIRKWDAPSFQDKKCQIREELERRMGIMETSLNKLGMILDSIQSDVMQINKGTKEVSLEMEGVRQKMIANDSSLQLVKKGQEETKTSLEEGFKFMSELLNRDQYAEKLLQISTVLSALPEQMEGSLRKLRNELQITFTKEMQAIACDLKITAQKSPSITMISPMVAGCPASEQIIKERTKNLAKARKATRGENFVPKVEMGSWESVKKERSTFTGMAPHTYQKPTKIPSVKQERKFEVTVESDEDINGGFSCLIDEKETGIDNYMIEEDTEETERILRKASRRKRKSFNPIIIN